jgi:hypothetical protein
MAHQEPELIPVSVATRSTTPPRWDAGPIAGYLPSYYWYPKKSVSLLKEMDIKNTNVLNSRQSTENEGQK